MKKNDNALLAEYLKKILNSKVYELAEQTDLQEATSLSRRYGSKFLLKREDLQSGQE